MTIDFRLPNITGKTDTEQLRQMKSYLYQLAGTLQYAVSMTSSAGTGTTGTGSTSSGTPSSAPEKCPAETFNEIKSLIIQSADIVSAYYEIISQQLSGLYVAESEFGTYKEEKNAEYKATSDRLDALFRNVQTISGALESTIAANAYVRTGLLYYGEDGVPVYGMEIGQSNEVDGTEVFRKFARFTADRVGFYDANDVEVAYISGFRLYITNAHVTGSMQVGAFLFDTNNGLAIKCVQGGN